MRPGGLCSESSDAGFDRGCGSGTETCHDMITNAGDTLLARAREADAVRPGMTITQLLKLVGAIALAAEQDIDGPGRGRPAACDRHDGVSPPKPNES
ncbi:hypothetical protein [Streptomyces katrae]|uniref:SbtR family transcriptional regulator n=1 Tax=Streptomyces katrae TaxID=68223 RepID=UPI00316ADDDD